MHFNSLGLTTAVVASVLMLSACNKPGAAPATPAVNAALVPDANAVPAVPAPTVAAPASATVEAGHITGPHSPPLDDQPAVHSERGRS